MKEEYDVICYGNMAPQNQLVVSSYVGLDHAYKHKAIYVGFDGEYNHDLGKLYKKGRVESMCLYVVF